MQPPADHLTASLVERATQRLDAMLDDLRRLIELESPSSDLAALARSAEAVADVIEQRLGRRPDDVPVDGVPHLRLRLGDGPTRVLLLAHHDTVWPIGTLGRLPFSVEDGVLRGPGSFDMLTGLVMAVHACALLGESGGGAGLDGVELDGAGLDGVELLVTGDEEVGSTTSEALILESAQGADAVLVLEASADGGAVKLARKGVAKFRITLGGRAAHAGLEPEKGVSTLLELVELVPRIVALADAAAGTSVTPTTFGGGSSMNTVPSTAYVDVDVRAASAEELDRVTTAMHALTAVQPGATVQAEGGVNRWPLERRHSEALYARYGEVCRELGLPVPEGVAVGGASDGNFTAAAGIPTLDGLGAVGGGAHADHEHALIDQIAPRTAALAALIADLLAAEPGRPSR